VHLTSRIGAEALDLVQHASVGECRTLLGAPVGAAPPGRGDAPGDLRIGRAAAEQVSKIEPVFPVETEQPGAVRP